MVVPSPARAQRMFAIWISVILPSLFQPIYV
jgi:hypothetical protein